MIKIVFVGDSGTGKTTIFRAIFGLTMDRNYTPTLEPTVLSLPELVTIWDTPGEKGPYDVSGQEWLKNAKLAVIFYSISDFQSIYSLQYWFNLVVSNSGLIPLLIVANKIDLIDTPLGRTELLAEGKKLASEVGRLRKLNSPPFIEISALDQPKSAYKVLNTALKMIALPEQGKKTFQTEEDPEKSLFASRMAKIRSNLTNVASELSRKTGPIPDEIMRLIFNFLEKDRLIRDCFERLKPAAVENLLRTVAGDGRWTTSKENFMYLSIYNEIQMILPMWQGDPRFNPIIQHITDFFLRDSSALSRFRTLSESQREAILSDLLRGVKSIQSIGDDIYLKYRDLIYSR